MSLMMSMSCIVLLLIVSGVVVAMNPAWLNNMFGKQSPGVVDWATGAPGATQSPYVYSVPPLYTQYPMYTWAPAVQQR